MDSVVAVGGDPSVLALPQRQKVVLVMDLVESVRLMAANETAVIGHWRSFVRRAVDDVLPRHSGRLVKSLGDGIMAEFDSARDGVGAALELHRHFQDTNAGLPTEERLYLRAGINATRVFVDDIDIYGSGVNLAARVASLAGPGETMVTADVREALADGLDAQIHDMGDCYLKHVAGPTRVARVGPAGPAPQLFPQRDYGSFEPTVAVIPFSSHGRAEEHLAIGELIAEGVIAQLSRTPGLRVIARLSATALRDRAISIEDIGAHTGASYVVSGSFLHLNGKLRTGVELGSAKDSTVLWTNQSISDVEDLLQPDSALCMEIASEVVRAIVQAEAKRVSYQPLPSLQGSTLLLGSIALMHRRSTADMHRAQLTLSHLNERYPRQALGHAWLAKSFVLVAGQGGAQTSLPELTRRASEAANKALSLDPENSLALTVNGIVRANLSGDFETAKQHYESALAADPNNSLAWLYSAVVAAFEGDGPLSWERAQRALALSPIDPQKYIYQGIAATACLTNSDHEGAVHLATESLRLNRVHMSAWRVKVIALMLLGRLQEAQAAATHIRQLTPDFTVSEFLRRNRSAATRLTEVFAKALNDAGIPMHN